MIIADAGIKALRERLGRTFPAVDAVFDECAGDAMRLLSEQGVDDWLEGAMFLGNLGRGAEPMLVFLEEAPQVAAIIGEDAIRQMRDFAHAISRTPNGDAVVPFLQTAAKAARRLDDIDLFADYVELARGVMQATTTSVHGIAATHPSPCFIDFLKSVPSLLQKVPLSGMKNWIEFGVNGYMNDPQGQSNYFALQSADSHNVLQRERHGVLLVDHERLLSLYLKSCWRTEVKFRPYSLLFDEIRKTAPYWDRQGVHLPDVYDERNDVSGINRYRAALAHIAAHQRWTRPIPGDNFSPFQMLAAATFEDMRIEQLAMREWPGLRWLWKALHPRPTEGSAPAGACDVHHRLAMLSYAALDPDHHYADPVLNDFLGRFMALLHDGMQTQDTGELARAWYVASKKESDLSANMYLTDVEVDYRDDNRHMWIHHEADEDAQTPGRSEAEAEEQEEGALPPRHYDEWDYRCQIYRPDWVSVYEALHASGDAAVIDNLLARRHSLAKRLKQQLDMLKPQERVRIRYQEDGSELDLDVAIRSLIDFRGGGVPDPRINMSHRTDGRDIAVMLLLDLSRSLNEKAAGSNQTILELSQEAVSLLAWSIDQVGDPFAIAGFHSNTRHNVRYHHIKGYSESWSDEVKSRLAAMQAEFSTRMGAAMRHAGHYLKSQKADKKLMLVLTDGEPSDIDADDGQLLIQDARQAVNELDRENIYAYCINLDAKADEYVSDIFGSRYAIIDHVDRLPEKLPEIFIRLTK